MMLINYELDVITLWFREDSPGEEVECSKLYSDPEFFFRKWKAELLEEYKKAKYENTTLFPLNSLKGFGVFCPWSKGKKLWKRCKISSKVQNLPKVETLAMLRFTYDH